MFDIKLKNYKFLVENFQDILSLLPIKVAEILQFKTVLVFKLFINWIF